MSVTVSDAAFAPAELLARFPTVAGAGGVASFVGLCRPASDGAAVGSLFLDAHRTFSLAELKRLAAEAMDRFDLLDLLLHHRHGLIAPGEAIVLVAAASAHRRPALDAIDFAMDQLKTRAPFWKREARDGGDVWLEPHPTDVARAAAWYEAG